MAAKLLFGSMYRYICGGGDETQSIRDQQREWFLLRTAASTYLSRHENSNWNEDDWPTVKTVASQACAFGVADANRL